jgi:hypothetical protein
MVHERAVGHGFKMHIPDLFTFCISKNQVGLVCELGLIDKKSHVEDFFELNVA